VRQLLFAPQSDALVAAVSIQIRQAVDRWLAGQVQLTDVQVLSGADPGTGLDEGELLITVSYVLVDTRTPSTLTLKVV
jgi:hypothetical protein